MVFEHMERVGLDVLIVCKPNPLWVYYGKTQVPSWLRRKKGSVRRIDNRYCHKPTVFARAGGLEALF
jgi:hypothetical protein